MDFATLQDVEDIYEPLENETGLRAQALLAAASAMIRAQVPSVDDRIASGAISADLARHITAAMVVRVLRNPAGVRQDTTGPFSVTYADASPGSLWLTAEELALLAGPPQRRAKSIRLRSWT